MTLIEKLQNRYATKKFDPTKKVSKEKITLILKAANLSASSFGLQPYKFVLVNNEEKRRALINYSFGQTKVIEASHLLVLAIRTDINENFVEDYIHFVEKERELPEGALKEYKTMVSNFIKSLDTLKKHQWAAKQAYIAMGTLLIACAEEGVDSCPMEGFVAEKYDEVLGLKEKQLASVLVLPIGYAAEDDPYKALKKVRRPLEDMIQEI